MNYFGSQKPYPAVVPADVVGSVIVSSAGAVVAQDWPARARMVSFSAEMPFYLNMGSTKVALPSTNEPGTSISSARNVLNPSLRIITGGSTGYSLTARTSGVISLEFWSLGSS